MSDSWLLHDYVSCLSTCQFGKVDVSNESRLVLMIFWRLCCVDCVVRLVFSRWCLLTWKLILKMPCALIKYEMRQFVWRKKDFVGIIFNLVWFVFKIDGFLGLWQDVAGKFLQPLDSGLCWSQRVHKRDLILSGKVGSLPSTERVVGQQQPENSGCRT